MIVLGITSRAWGNEFTTEPSTCWTCLIFITLTMQPVLGQLKSDVWDPMTKEITVSQAAETTAPIMKRVYVKAYV